MAQAQSAPKPIPPPSSSRNLRLSPPGQLHASIDKLRHNAQLTPLAMASPVTQNGCFEFDRIIKSGAVHKRTRKTKSWKSIYIVLRPNLLSIYRDKDETKLRHQINLSELTAVARQKDPKRKDKFVFGLFSPSRNYHLEAGTEKEAQEWVELIRREARMDEDEEDMVLGSPGGTQRTFHGFERSMGIHAVKEDQEQYSSTEDEMPAALGSVPKTRDQDRASKNVGVRRPSHVEYSGAEGAGSYSDFSDFGLGAQGAARISALSLAASEGGRPSTSGPPPQNQNQNLSTTQPHAVYGASPQTQRPNLGTRTTSQMSVTAAGGQPQAQPEDNERVIYHNHIYFLKSHRGVRTWKKFWMVLRPRALAFYKDDAEYSAILIVPFDNIIDAVEIDPISKSKQYCMQVISEERNFRLCCTSEESLARWLGAFKSLLSRRKARDKGKEGTSVSTSVPLQ